MKLPFVLSLVGLGPWSGALGPHWILWDFLPILGPGSGLGLPCRSCPVCFVGDDPGTVRFFGFLQSRSFTEAKRRSHLASMALRRFVQDRQDLRPHEHVDPGEFHRESRGQFARRCRLCRLRNDGCDAHCWSLVGYTLETFQVVPGPTGPYFYLVAMIVTTAPPRRPPPTLW